MKGTITMGVLSLTLLLAGCSNAVRITGPLADCTDTTPAFELQYGTGKLLLNRECVDVSAGAMVELILDPVPTQAAVVSTKFKGPGNGWLDQENEANVRTIVLRVPQKKGKKYKFEIHVDGVGMLDPRIVIQP